MQANSKERARAIQELRSVYGLATLLELEGMAKSTFYYNLAAGRKPDPDSLLKQRIYDIYHTNKGRYGYRRIMLALHLEGLHVNHKKVEKIMKELGLKAVVRVVKYHSYKGAVGKIAPNLLQRNFQSEEPLTKMTTDISQVKIGNDKCFISPVIDMFNGEVLSCDVSRRPDLNQIKRMLDKLFETQDINRDKAILHSDQGWQYQHVYFSKALHSHGIRQSMSRKGNCLDNAIMESFFGSMKSELLYLEKFHSIEEFEKELKKYIYYYNNERIKTRLKMSPVQYRLKYQKTTTNPSNF